MTKKAVIAVLVFNLFIAASFFIMNYGVGYSRLSSDQHNIVPMCQKLDDPALFKNDLYLSSVDNFKYYTPFFVQPLRFMAKLTNGDYMLAINILHTATHILYGLSWFVLFYFVFKRNFWIAFLLSILIRGIVWLPGMEIWGMSDLWTFVPRQLYSALLPIPFIILLAKSSYRYRLFFSAFLIGLIFNFHPITGLGGILIYLFTLFFIGLKSNSILKLSFIRVLSSVVFIILGMLPFIITYFGKTETTATYNVELYQKAFDARIPSYFKDVVKYASQWIHIKTLFFLVPTAILFALSLFYKSLKKQSFFVLTLGAVLFIVPLLSIPIENWVNSAFNINLRMSFQIVRVQKLAILPGYLAMGFLLVWCMERKFISKKLLAGLTALYIFLIILATPNRFKPIPFISDDITTSIYCNGPVFASIEEKQRDFDKMAAYIKKETPVNAVFYKEYRLRSAALRSVKFDHKGASILIEGNPEELIEWYKAKRKLRKASELEKEFFLNEHDVTHILSEENFESYQMIKQIGMLKLYAIKN
ncbi:hypothetical protein [Marixanthomonas ophiurae]|uniref:Uncharacterized protein n=1 Tax=Marixanthomonas ophiurae TaxID=387659 RepID=A0A3E1QD66_9FLAO|nr:hypothetical protein [Marixanthomonas ophiurae]RFN60062.1 hypothetical protein DZ858_08440 [Marixanthomonas ophiurae]